MQFDLKNVLTDLLTESSRVPRGAETYSRLILRTVAWGSRKAAPVVAGAGGVTILVLVVKNSEVQSVYQEHHTKEKMHQQRIHFVRDETDQNGENGMSVFQFEEADWSRKNIKS
jgi:hypothetical protein